MSEPQVASNLFLVWLLSDEGKKYFAQRVNRVVRAVESMKLPDSVWPYPNSDDLNQKERDDLYDEVTHDLIVFICENYSRLSKSASFNLYVRKNRKQDLLGYITRSFLNHLKDKLNRNISLWHYSYDRLHKVLSNEGLLHNENSFFFSFEQKVPILVNTDRLHQEPYSVWKSPLNFVTESEFIGNTKGFSAKVIISLARQFWDEAASKLGQSYFLPLRELRAYLAAHFASLNPVMVIGLDQPSAGNNENGESGKGVNEAPGFQLNALNPLIAKELDADLDPLAYQLISNWSPTTREAFQIYYNESGVWDDNNEEWNLLSLEELSQKLGLKTASGAKYHLDKIHDALKDLIMFSSSWPGRVYPHIEREFFLKFLHRVAMICKKTGSAP